VTKFFFENKKFVAEYSFSIFEVENIAKIQQPHKSLLYSLAAG
jgi:hypothetical protein